MSYDIYLNGGTDTYLCLPKFKQGTYLGAPETAQMDTERIWLDKKVQFMVGYTSAAGTSATSMVASGHLPAGIKTIFGVLKGKNTAYYDERFRLLTNGVDEIEVASIQAQRGDVWTVGTVCGPVNHNLLTSGVPDDSLLIDNADTNWEIDYLNITGVEV